LVGKKIGKRNAEESIEREGDKEYKDKEVEE
jgi:hypothetical protein